MFIINKIKKNKTFQHGFTQHHFYPAQKKVLTKLDIKKTSYNRQFNIINQRHLWCWVYYFMFYVYLLQSKLNKQIYIGSTNDLPRRFKEHNKGLEKSTKRYLPWYLIYYEAYSTEKLARLREKRLKHNGNAIRELKKRIGLIKNKLDSSNPTFLGTKKSDIKERVYPAPLSFKSGAGFTLVELVVSISIIAVLTTMAITNFRGSNQKLILDNEAERIASVIRQMHINSLIGQTIEGVRPQSFGFYLEPCIHIGAPDFCEYTSFADDKDNGTVDHKLDAGDDILQVISTFEKNVEFSDIFAVGLPSVSLSAINIAFIPPQGIIQFFGNGANPLSNEALGIELHYYNTDYYKTIIINRISGQIEIVAGQI